MRELRQKIEVKDHMIEKMGHKEVETQMQFKQVEARCTELLHECQYLRVSLGDCEQKLELKTQQVDNLKNHYELQITDIKQLNSRDSSDREK